MVLHKEFTKAGKVPGLQVWRIEKMDLAPIDPALHGIFYVGDSYIVLNTTSFSYDIHAWFGSETSQDERGAAAIFMTQLDHSLNGVPVQYSECQNYESVTFMSYFPSGITYKSGGVASGFKKVKTNEASDLQVLLHVKGRRTVRATEVPFSWKSFNKGDCFIIDLGKILYHWSGSECNFFERLKATELGIAIRDNERSGRIDLEMIEEGSEPEEVIEALGPKPDLPPGCSDSDKHTDILNREAASLYLISDAAGSMKTTMVQDKNPFKQDDLRLTECYILNAVNVVFVWKGPEANPEEREAALIAAQKFCKDNNSPTNTQIQVMPAGGETSLFKQFFPNWLDKDETTGPSQPYTIGRIAKVEQDDFDASTLHDNPEMAAHHCMVDDGSGEVKIWRVEGGNKVPVDQSTYGQFFGGDCYLVLYTYNTSGSEKNIIYTWQGHKCTKDELTASAFLTVELDNSMNGVATQVRVTQGQEPPHLVSIFKDKPLVIHLGGTSRHCGESKPGSTRLYHIRQSSTRAVRAVEVLPTAPSLNTNDVFVMKSSDSLFIWKGAGGTEEEMTAAKYVASLLGGSATQVEETKEPAGFWAALGGKKEYQTSRALQRTLRPPRLFGCSNKTGRLIAEEVPGEFTQIDLAPDDVMILDTWEQIFIWIGNDANETEKEGSPKIAEDYVYSDPSGRCGIPIITVKQGNEPLYFTGWFQAWDPSMFDPKKWSTEKWEENCMQSVQQQKKCK